MTKETAPAGTNPSAEMFAQEYGSLAESVAKQLGVAPSLVLSHWGLESGYGTKPVGTFNFGNIKDFSGKGKEAVDNKLKTKDKYLNFESPEAFADYYAHNIKRLYPEVLNVGNDVMAFTNGLRHGVKGAYAQDEEYDDKIKNTYDTTRRYYKDPYETEASRIKREQEQAGTTTTTDGGGPPPTPEQMVSPTNTAIAGATANLLGQVPFNPNMPAEKPDLTGARQKYEDAQLLAQRASERLQRRLQSPNSLTGESLEDLEQEYRQREAEVKNQKELLNSLENQHRQFEAPQRPNIKEILNPQVEINPETGEMMPRASGAKEEGASGVKNWMKAEAGQAHQVPELIQNMATDKTKTSETGAKKLIEKDLENLQKIQSISGVGENYALTAPNKSQLMVPSDIANEKFTEEQKRLNEIAQKKQEAELERQRQAQEAQEKYNRELEQFKTKKNIYSGMIGETKTAHEEARRKLQEAERALRLARSSKQRGVERATTASESAQDKAHLAQQNLQTAEQGAKAYPGATMRALEVTGVKSASKGFMGNTGRAISGGAMGAYAGMSANELKERYDAGDRSPELIKSIIGVVGPSTALVPAMGPKTARVKGAGTLATGAVMGYDLYKMIQKANEQANAEEKQ